MKWKRGLSLLLLLTILLTLLCGCAAKGETEIKSVEDLAGKRIGVTTGSIFDQIAEEFIKNPKLEYFNSVTDMAQALNAGKIDGYIYDEPVARILTAKNPGQKILETLKPDNYGVIFPMTDEGAALRDQFDTFLAKLKADGTLEEINALWFGTDEAAKVVDMEALTGENGTLNLATCSTKEPFSYIKDGKLAGYEADIAVRFCKEYGYALEISDSNFAGVIAAVSSEKSDFGMASISITEERKKSMNFSEPDYNGGVVLVTKGSTAPAVTAEIKSAEDLAGKRVGVVLGSIDDVVAEEHIKNPKIEYYNTIPDLAQALNAGKLDGYVADKAVMRILTAKNPDHTILEVLMPDTYGFIFPKTDEGAALRDQFNEFLAKLKADGTFDAIDALWFGSDEAAKVVDLDALTGENGTLNYSTSSSFDPFAYIKDGKLVGYEIDIAARFCKEYGYALEVSDSNFSGVLASVSSGKSDFGSSAISITEERKETMYFSEPDYNGGIVLVAKGSTAPAAAGEFRSIEDLAGKRIGVQTGTRADEIARKHIEAPQIEYFVGVADSPMALDAGKIDAYIVDEPIGRALFREYPTHRFLTALEEDQYGFVFPKTEKGAVLRDQFNEFLAKIKADGTLEEIDAIWFGDDESKKVVDDSSLTGENGTLAFATESGTPPFSYVKDGKLVGYEIDLAVRFCKEYGYALNMSDIAFNGLLASVSVGKSDFAATCIAITEERKETMYFSEPDYKGGVMLVVKDSTAPAAETEIRSIEDLEGKRIAVITGSVFDDAVQQSVKNPQLVYVNSMTDAALALDTGKVDAYSADEPAALMLIQEYPTQRILKKITDEDYAYAIGRTEKRDTIYAQLNEYLAKIREDGTMDALRALWISGEKKDQVIDFSVLTGENGTLRFGVSTAATGEPFDYLSDGQFCGYEIDIVAHFCREYGYGIEIEDMNVPGVFAALESGKVDIGAMCIAVTEERRESGLLFSDPSYSGGVVLVVKDDASAEETASGGILESLEKTFVREGRWKLFVSGIGITVLITVLAVLFGTVLGFLLFLAYRKNNCIFNGFLNVLMDILEKTPVVVILMILYYVIFGKSNLDGVWVSVVGFSVMFACSFVGTLKVGVMAVDKGQTEAFLAMGFKDTHGFLRIILPQAAKHFLPNYRGKIVSLLKDTAIVGYIAVQDLTKVGDIVRSRTYEAFFPLIATAIIYFLLAWILTLLVRRIEFHTDPTHRSEKAILKGVKTK